MNDDFERIDDRHDARRRNVEVLADMIFQLVQGDDAFDFADADVFAEVADGGWRVTASAQPGDGRHARVVPTAHVAFLDQPDQLALAQHRMAQVQAGEFDLLGMIDFDIVQIPVVERAMVFVFQRANRMRDSFDGIRLAVGEVVHGVDFPLVARARMRCIQDAVHHRIAHVDIAAGHVDLCSQHRLAFLETAGAHFLE